MLGTGALVHADEEVDDADVELVETLDMEVEELVAVILPTLTATAPVGFALLTVTAPDWRLQIPS